MGVCFFVLVCFVASSPGFAISCTAGNVHTVVPGDTLYRIAHTNGTYWAVLAAYNQITNPQLIFPGQQIRIPDFSHYSWIDIYAELLRNFEWQMAYAALLRRYAVLPLGTEWERGWHFALHDINQDGIPELFLVMFYYTGHVSFRLVYTFVYGRYLPLEFENTMTDGGMFAHSDGSPFIFVFIAAGSGGIFHRRLIDGDRIVTDYSGFARPTDEGINRAHVVVSHSWLYLYINAYPETQFDEGFHPATIEQFENIFGRVEDRIWFQFYPIIEDNVRDVLFNRLPSQESLRTSYCLW